MGLFGPPEIAKLEAKADIKGLLDALGYKKDAGVRAQAATSLASLCIRVLDNSRQRVDASAVFDWQASDNWNKAIEAVSAVATVLSSALADPEPEVRRSVASALGRIGVPVSVPALAVFMADPDPSVRRAIVDALTAIPDTRANPLLVAYWIPELSSPSITTRLQAARALGKLGDPAAVTALAASLNDPDHDVCTAVASALGQIGDPAAIEPLSAGFASSIAGIRLSVALALSSIGGEAVRPPLLAALSDPDASVRRAAAEGLDKAGWVPAADEVAAAYWAARGDWSKCGEVGPPAVETLLAALDTGPKEARQSVSVALGKIRDARAVEPLIAVLGNPDGAGHEGAALALGEIGDPRAVEPLIHALKHPIPRVRDAAAASLGRIGDLRAVEPLVTVGRFWDHKIAPAERAALIAIGPTATDQLVACLSQPDDDVRKAAADGLDGLAWSPGADASGAAYWAARWRWDKCVEIGAAAADALALAMSVLPARQSLPAAEALDGIGWKPDNGQAGGAYWAAKENWDGCVEIGAPAVDVLIPLLGAAGCRDSVATALGKIGDARAMEPLIGLLTNSEWETRLAAANGLVRLYRAGNLTDAQKVRILDQRPTMVAPRTQDNPPHDDWSSSSDCSHRDTGGSHVDVGIGVDFPV
jgi:HEAT repeat protein